MSLSQAIPLRYLAQINPATPKAKLLKPQTNVTFLPLDAVWPDGKLDVSRVRKIGIGTGSYTTLQEGDIIFPKVTPSFEHNRVAIARGLTNELALASTEVHVVRPLAPELTELLHYRLRAADFQASGRAGMIGVAGLRRVPEQAVGALPIPVHGIERAHEIVSALNERCSGLSDLSHRLSALEQRVAEASLTLIEEAAGSSGPWTSVPLWSVVNVARPVMYGIVLPGPHLLGGVPLIKGGDVERNRLNPGLLDCTSAEIDETHRRSRVETGDVLLTIRGSFGAAAVVPPELAGANITQDTARISPGPNVLSQWLLYALRAASAQNQMRAHRVGASIKGVNICDIRRIRIPCPPLDEQERILMALQPHISRLDDLANRANRMRTLLGGYRDSLITEQFAVSPNKDELRAGAPPISDQHGLDPILVG